MFILIAILLSELAIGGTLGFFLAKRLPKALPVIVVALVLYIFASIYFAYLATQYPGPDSRYASDFHGQWIRSYVTVPTTAMWIAGPFVSTLFVSYWQAPRNKIQHVSLSIEHVGYSSAISLLFFPIWIMGASIHGANVAGAWF